jgi:hypothetical protein
MSIAKWAAPSARSANIAGTTLNSLANLSESTAVTYNNSANLDLYAVVTIKLGSITPSASGSITLRVTLNDGTDTADRIGGDQYIIPLTTGTGAKVAVQNMVRIYPFNNRLSVVNNAGVTLAASGNEIYVTPWNEEIV